MLNFASHANLNRLYWITSLGPSAQGVTFRIREDLEPYFASLSLPFQIFEPNTAGELLAFLDDVARDSSAAVGSIIHLDMHGSEQQGVQISASGEFVTWAQLCEKFQTINIVTRNNLCVVSAACFSLRMAREMDVTRASPFYLMIAPQNEVTSGFVEQNTVAFYRAIFDGGDIVSGYETHLASGMTLLHSEKLLVVAMARYFKNSCTGSGGAERREKLLTQALASGIANNRRNRRKIRTQNKALTRPSAVTFHRYVSVFLIGKPINIGFADVMQLVKRSP
jgi:hypothetical protein